MDVQICCLQVKPTRGGSSIGVRVAYGVADSLAKANEIMSEVPFVHLRLDWEQIFFIL